MRTVFFLKNRAANVSREEFEDYMTNERPPILESITEIQRYELWFPAADSTYDSVETLSFVDREAMERALNSPVAADLHETGSSYVDFDAEEVLVMESAREFGSSSD